jgi:hypothetical protein
MVIGLDFPARTTLTKEEIPRTQGAIIIPKIPAITLITPAGLESCAVEQLAPALCGTIHQEEIIAPEPDDGSLLQVFRTGGLRNPVKFESSCRRHAGDAQAGLP